MKLSVVIPTHNRRELLREVLDALARQTHPASRFEVVVVADGSEDGTMEMLRNLQLPYGLRSYWQRQSGVARARNRGIEEAAGDIVLFIDDDVIPLPDLVEEHVRWHEGDDNAVVIGRVSPPPRSKRPGWSKWEEQLLERHFETLAQKRRRTTARHVYSGNFSVRRRHLVSVGGFDESMTRAEDIDLGYRLERGGLHFCFNPKANGIHCGYQSYEGWRRISYQYGRLDVLMCRDKGYRGTLGARFASFRGANILVRLSVAICLDHGTVSGLLIGLLRYVAQCGDYLGMSRLTRYLYSGISNLLYWQGFSDELGGSVVFWREVERHRFAVGDQGHDTSHTS
ncbi:MAG: glycosyltransferase family 2 protein [Chloroflexi bacterium]|nr:glycosyltransferase family 2 protein [Chloroflexota bacterium]